MSDNNEVDQVAQDGKVEPEVVVHDNPAFWLLPWQLKAAVFLTFATFIICVVVSIQVQQRNPAIADAKTASQTSVAASQKAEDAANEAKAAAEKASADLKNVIDANINSPQAQENTRATRQRILNIEQGVCGGPCPAATETAPNTPPARNQ